MASVNEQHEQNRSCGICLTQFAKYTCPKCNIQYCSVKCYQSNNHGACSEKFYKDCLMEELSNRKVNNEDKMKMIEILERVKENEIIDINSDDDDDPSIEERLSGIDLDSDTDQIWKKLTDKEKQLFHDMFQSGTLAELVTYKPVWWETIPKVMNASEEQPSHDVPIIPSGIPPLSSLVQSSLSSYIPCNIINVLYSYAYTVRLFNNSLSDLPIQVTQSMLDISGVLSDNINYSTVEDAIQHAIASVKCRPHMFNSLEYSHFIIRDVIKLIHTTSWSGCLLCTHALADVFEIIGNARKAIPKDSEKLRKDLFLTRKKMLFFISWCIDRGPVELLPLVKILEK